MATLLRVGLPAGSSVLHRNHLWVLGCLTSNTQEAAPAGIRTETFEPDISTATGTARMSGISVARAGERPSTTTARERARLSNLAKRGEPEEMLGVTFVFIRKVAGFGLGSTRVGLSDRYQLRGGRLMVCTSQQDWSHHKGTSFCDASDINFGMIIRVFPPRRSGNGGSPCRRLRVSRRRTPSLDKQRQPSVALRAFPVPIPLTGLP
jgi:hypothetical protein